MRYFFAMSLSHTVFPAAAALADPVKIACEGETITIPGWGSGTMTLTFDGGSPGTLTVKGPHVEFTVPASSQKFESPLPPLRIDGSGDTKMLLPDLKAVDTCVAGKLPGKYDPDTYAIFATSCLEKIPASATPQSAHASATITFMRGADMQALGPLVQMKLSYLDKSADPTGKLMIELMPKDCKVIP
jgi:hypothetical protein